MIILEDLDKDRTVDPSVGTEQDRADVYDFLTDKSRELILLAMYDKSQSSWVNKNHDNHGTYNLVAGIWYRLRILTVNPGELLLLLLSLLFPVSLPVWFRVSHNHQNATDKFSYDYSSPLVSSVPDNK